ncbi:MAG: HD domain-containing protein [Ilumatobacteraceae bacterium]
MSDRVDEALATIEQTFYSAEGMAYLGEDVTMIQHQLQAAALAVGCSDALVVSALLHDIGHVIGRQEGEADATEALADERDAHHDSTGARWLAQWFGPDVTEPVRLHVAAKRYLVATEPDYAVKLSEASVHTLQLQGGPMSAKEVEEFEALQYAQEAVALRRLDEAAKDGSRDAPDVDAYRDLLVRVLAHHR